MRELGDLQRNRLLAQEQEFEAERNKLEAASQALITSKSAIIEELKGEVRQTEIELRRRGARPEDAEHLARLEEIIAERQDALESLSADYRKYEAAMIETETCFNRLAAGHTEKSELGPSMLGSAGGKRIRSDGIMSGRKPTVIEPSTTPKKSRSPL
jgi:DNA repair exonuclease SbcCD ATPase subunit